MQVKKQQLESNLEQWTWFKIGKGVRQGYILSPCLFNLGAEYIMQKCQVGWIMSWNQGCREKYQQPQICRWYHPNGRKWRGTEEHLDEGEGGEWKSWRKTKIMESGPITSWLIDGGKVETVTDFIFLVSKITVNSDSSHEINLDSILKAETLICQQTSI